MHTNGGILVASLAMLAAGCSTGTRVEATAPAGYVADAASATKGVDWLHAEPVTVRMTEYHYLPDRISLQAGKPYRLHIENVGGTAHTFTSEGFFEAIAARSLATSGSATADYPYIKELELAPGQSADIQFVGVKAGDYGLACDEPFHKSLGMTGTIRIR